MNDLVEKTRQLGAAALARSAKAAVAKPDEPTQIPLWPSNVRGMPNSLARSALFNVNRAAAPRDRYFPGKQIASSGTTTITHKGEELRQDDADVFLEILHLARDTILSERVEFTGYAMLKTLGWDTSSKGYERLVKILERLQESSLKVAFEGNRKGFQGSLIRKFIWKDGTETDSDGQTRWICYIEPEIARLFASDDYSRVAREQRLRLRSELSKWLHSYYNTHAAPFAVSVKFIHQQCGSQAKALSHFRVTLKKALTELQSVGFLASWKIDDDDKVHVGKAARAISA
ncbi:plasmid replication initiator TrfA [Pararobbsia silviterrae]|uniref:TrfA family protein n=1 Tax=Pararobbsia silviterrae TaxID=1792498 RepID=A0A494X2W3_9BURK|nr:plasmid replication initiator TrfA [Pararobbsia silviterrae]RKP44702.1 TrfA family protein [Pararobbsia silviterrae]